MYSHLLNTPFQLWYPKEDPDTKKDLIGHDYSSDEEEPDKTHEAGRKKFSKSHGLEQEHVRFSAHLSANQAVIPLSLMAGIKAVCHDEEDPKLVAPAGFSYTAKKADWNICVAT